MLICLYRALTSENPTQQHFPLTEEAFTKLHPSPAPPHSKRNKYRRIRKLSDYLQITSEQEEVVDFSHKPKMFGQNEKFLNEVFIKGQLTIHVSLLKPMIARFKLFSDNSAMCNSALMQHFEFDIYSSTFESFHLSLLCHDCKICLCLSEL